MKKLLIALVIVGGLGYGIYALTTRSELGRFGISSDHPLGKIGELDSILTQDLKLLKDRITTLDGTDIPPTAEMYRYRDPGNRYVYLVLLLDNQSKIEGIAGWYHTPTHSPVAFFLEAQWSRCGGPRSPQFTMYETPALAHYEASFSADPVSGTWEKSKSKTAVPQDVTHQHIYLRLE